jgi:hypothetical protein
MKRLHSTNPFFSPLILLFFASFFISCSTVNNVVQNLLTFSITKTAPAIPIPPQTPVGILFALPGVPLAIDSADLAKNKTSLSLVKTLKLTDWTIAIDTPTYSRTNIDSMSISVGLDSLHTTLLGTYSGPNDKITLTNADFAADAKNSNDKFFLTFKLKKDPQNTVHLLTSYTLTFTADPL